MTLVDIANEQDNTCADCGFIEGYCFPHSSYTPPSPYNKPVNPPVLLTLHNVHIFLLICNIE